MHIRTIEEDYEYRMKNLMEKFVKDYDLILLAGDELYEEIWDKHSKEFGRAVLEDMYNYSGNELFGDAEPEE
jgi:hypothetical protein